MAMATTVTVLALGASACGDDDGDGGSPGASSGGDATLPEGRRGGTATVLSAGDVDYVDPGQTYYVFGYQVAYATQRPLYTYKPGDLELPTPDLATSQPEVSDDGRTITVRLRRGVRFSPPVDREVTAADVKYAIERAFSINVPSSYAGIYFGGIAGAPSEPTDGVRDIRGLTTPDRHTLEIRLRRPGAAVVSAALAMPITMPVPEEYAREHDARNPSTYDSAVVFTGPYMIENDAQGRLTGRRPGRSITLVRNPSWKADGDFRPAYLDRIEIEEGNDDSAVSSRRILAGSGLLQGDGAPPAQIVKQALQRSKSQITFVAGGSNRFVALNTRIPPFDDINVRKAVLAVFDRRAMLLTRGGSVVGEIATHFLPPGFPGFEEAGGAQGAGVDFLQNPSGDRALAASYMRKAGFESGRYEGDEELLMVGTNADPGKRTAEVALEQLRKLGFKVRLRLAPQDTLYTRYYGSPRANLAIFPNVGASRDFNDPQSLLEPYFGGESILQQNNSNWSELDDPAIDSAMARAAVLPAGDERNRAWGEIDKMIVEQAAAVPWVWDKTPLIASKDVQGVANEYMTGWDLAYTSLK
jgi:peptide/nickel transport system substrate-binding protein